jgi:two-component system, chemotaxis family, sensor kinase CheA
VDGVDEIVQEFLVESHENLDRLDRDLVALEQEPDSRELLSSVFRTIHTIKGTSGFLAFGRLESLTHVGENLLSQLRDGVRRMNPQTTDLLLRMVDTVRVLLASIEQTGAEGDVAVDDLVRAIEVVLSAPEAPAEPSPAPAEPSPAPAAAEPSVTGSVAAEPAASAPETTVPAAPTPDAPAVSVAVPVAVAPAAPAGEPAGGEDSPVRASRVGENTIRVDVELLDALMRQVGELVLTRNQVVQHASANHDVTLLRASQKLNLITSELQEGVMKTRMQPIDQIWSKLPRVVRDLAQTCGKQVRLEMHGRETELDRTLLDAVKDPLTHLVRNAVDHGIEPADARRAAGKSPEGVLTLRSYHAGGHVIVEVCDDGAGIDPARVAEKAVSRGLISADRVPRMSEEEILAFVFQPGFSTAAAVTNVSGRGVGMDVVRTNIEKIGGTVGVESRVGQGTTWRLTIPLTLAIAQVLTVECQNDRYAIPQAAVQELVSLTEQGVEYVSGVPVHRLRGKLLPLVRLADVLGVGAEGPISGCVVVLTVDGRSFGMVVDRVLTTEEIVVKPLSSRLKGIGVYAGATILGDGGVALILDVAALARTGLPASELGQQTATSEEVVSEERTTDADRLLLVGIGSRRLAIPLESVTRLERFRAQDVERVGSREVVQYRDQILPVSRLATLIGVYESSESAELHAVVHTERGRSVALVVDEILDVVDADVVSDVDDSGLTGSTVVQKRVTELLDVRQAILAADPRFYIQQDTSFGDAEFGMSEHVGTGV